MKCPICKSATQVEVDTHADGFAKNLQECGACGALWTTKENRDIVLNGPGLHAA